MKKIIPILLISILSVLQLSAKRDDVPKSAITSKMERAGEKYVKMILKEFPEKAAGLSSFKARKKIYEEMAKSGILTLDGATQVKLKKREEVVTDPQMQTMIKNLEDDDSKETKFLLTLAKNDRLKDEGKLLVFRLLGQVDVARKKQAKQDAEDALSAIFKHYQEKVKELGRKPADAEELALPAAIAKSAGKDWIYFGTRLHLGTKMGKVLLIDPNPLPGGTATKALTDKGNVINLNYEEMMEHWNKVKDKPAPKPKNENENKPTPEKSPAPAGNTAYNKKVLENFKAAFQKVINKQSATKIWPITLEDAGVSGEGLTQESPDGTEKERWVYVASKAKIAVSKNQFVIMVAPYPSGKDHLIALSDGKVVTISAAEFQKIKNAIKGR